MTERISVGDLVMVVRGHECAVAILGGVPRRVYGFRPQTGGGWVCPSCRKRDIAPSATIGARLFQGGDSAIPLAWLKKIPPLSELESEQRKEEVGA